MRLIGHVRGAGTRVFFRNFAQGVRRVPLEPRILQRRRQNVHVERKGDDSVFLQFRWEGPDGPAIGRQGYARVGQEEDLVEEKEGEKAEEQEEYEEEEDLAGRRQQG